MKLDVPRFDGSDPSGWCFKITQFFEYHSTPETERLLIASFAMEGPTLAWFQWLSRNGQLSTWSAFLHAIEAQFAPSQYEGPIGLLCNLTQQGTVSVYLSQFEHLTNRIMGLRPSCSAASFSASLLMSAVRSKPFSH